MTASPAAPDPRWQRGPALPYGRRRRAPARAGMPALEARGVSVRYAGVATPALHDVWLTVPIGARVALVGPNGAGKSTLLKAAAGLLPVSAGELRIYGQAVEACHHRVAYLPQRGEVDWRFPVSVRRLVLTGRYVHLGWLRRPGARDRALADAAVERLGLTALAELPIGQLSGGQQQRALLARALAQDADLLLLDEPLNAVDAANRAVVAHVLDELRQQRKTVLVATHDLGRLDRDYDGALFLSEGRPQPAPPGSFSGPSLAGESS